MIKKSLLLLTAVIMGASSLTHAANITNITVTNKDNNPKTGSKGSTIYVKVGSTVKEIKKNQTATFTLPKSAKGFAITASKKANVKKNTLTAPIYNTKLSYTGVKSKPKVQIDVTKEKVTAVK